MPTTNFIQFDPPLANAETDVSYVADATRSGGAVSGALLPSALFNKFAYQLSTFITAFANMLVAKGYSPSDANLATLTALLMNVKTSADFPASIVVVPYSTSVTFNANQASEFDLTMTGNVSSSSLINIVPGQLLTFIISQDVSGARTFVWPTNVPGGQICQFGAATTMQSFVVRADGVTVEALGPAVWQTSGFAPFAFIPARVVLINTSGSVSNDGIATEIVEEVDSSGGSVVRTLFTAVGFSGFKVNVKKIDTSANSVTVQTVGGQTIDGFANYTITKPYNSLTFASDGSNWILI